MNGDSKTIYEAILNVDEKITIVRVDIASIKATRKERHTENLKKFDIIFDKLDEVGNVTHLKSEVQRLQWIVFVVIILGLFMQIK